MASSKVDLQSLQLLHILDKWTDYLEYGGQIDVVYSDLENNI